MGEVGNADERATAVREVLVAAIARDLEHSIAALGYPVGMGVAPHPDVCLVAAGRIVENITTKAFALMADATRASMLEALRWTTNWIIAHGDSGDAGFWDAREWPEIKAAQAAISLATQGEG